MPALPTPRRGAPPRRRYGATLWLLLGVLLLHALVLVALAPAGVEGTAVPRRAPAMRLVMLPGPTVAPPPSTSPPLAGRPPKVAAPARHVPASARTPKPAAVVSAAAAAGAGPVVAATAPPAAATGASAAEPMPAGTPLPVYATRLPASASLHYTLRRGALDGTGQLVWRRQGETYEISLAGELQGLPVLGSVSRGLIDADGVAPLRLVDRRRSRELRAVNFQRESRLITFSGPQLEYPLLAGAQDRLSWMVQLSGIVEADAALGLPGARVSLFVAGTRGDAEAWHFEVQGRDALDLPAGHVADALYLKREPTRPYDSRVEVWLDPARQHLPVRALLTPVPQGPPTDLRLIRSAGFGD